MDTGWSPGIRIPSGSGQGWYNYNPATHAITAIPGRVLMVRTADNRYANVSIVNYNKGLPDVPAADSESRLVTFDFVFQPDGSKSFE